MEKQEKVRVTLMMPEGMFEKVDELAIEMAEARSTVIKMLIRNALQNEAMKKAMGLELSNAVIEPEDKG